MKNTALNFFVTIPALMILSTGLLHAQVATDLDTTENLDDALRVRIGLIARGDADSVVLRWVPTKPAVWLSGSRVGYWIERATVRPDGSQSDFESLRSSPVVPWSDDQWQAYAAALTIIETSSPDYAAIAFSLLDAAQEGAPAQNEYSANEVVSIAERKNEFEMRFGFAMYSVDRSVAAAEGLGLRFVDRTVEPNTTYLYRVFLAGQAGIYRPDTGFVSVVARDPRHIDPLQLRTEGGDGQIQLQWEADDRFGSYFIERSNDGGKSFRRMNSVPVTTLRHSDVSEDDVELYLDSSATNYAIYHYRVFGTTAFADEVLVAEGQGMARDVTPPATPFLPNPEHVADREVRVRWIPGLPETPDLAGFRVSRAATEAGPFLALTARPLPASTREFVDTEFPTDSSSYYVIEAIDTAGNSARSNSAYVVLIDNTPPAPPVWINGTMDTNGVVTLRLQANRERDLLGYRIFTANAADHEFSVLIESFDDSSLTPPHDSIYYDTVTVRSLTRAVYYRAVALDRNFNPSQFSEILVVQRPDVIPPVTPVVVDVRVTDTSVGLRYVPSSSLDVAYHTLLRRTGDTTRWDSVAAGGRIDSLFADRVVERNVVYQYALIATDSSGLNSDTSIAVLARPYKSGVRPVVVNLQSSYDRQSNSVRLVWDYNNLNENYWFVVYRKEAGEAALRPYAHISSTDREAVDVRPAGSTTLYSVRVVTGTGARSQLSQTTEVNAGQ